MVCLYFKELEIGLFGALARSEGWDQLFFFFLVYSTFVAVFRLPIPPPGSQRQSGASSSREQQWSVQRDSLVASPPPCNHQPHLWSPFVGKRGECSVRSAGIAARAVLVSADVLCPPS